MTTSTTETTPKGICQACGENPAHDICKACEIRTEGLILTQSALQELMSIQRALEAQEAFLTDATDWEIDQAGTRLINRLISAHDSLEDAGTAANTGLATK